MSQTVHGKISSGDGFGFIATFYFSETRMLASFSGKLVPTVEPFSSADVTLTYDSLSQLTGIRQFDGQLGERNIRILMTNGPTLVGVLNDPIVPAKEISGSGSWVVN